MATSRIAAVILSVVAGIVSCDPAQAATCDSILGRWGWFIGGEVTVRADGTFTQQSGNAGTWKCNDGARGRFTFRWRDGGFVNRLVLSPDGRGLSSTDAAQSYVTAQRTASAPQARHDENCCQRQFGCETRKIEADYTRDLALCHQPGNAACNRQALERKAARLRAANQQLRACDRARRPAGPQTGSTLPPRPVTGGDEFHSDEGTGDAAPACAVCDAEGNPTGGDIFDSDSPGTERNPPPTSDRVPPYDPTAADPSNTGVAVPGACVNSPYDVRNDVRGADDRLRYTLGFERGFAGCLEKQATVQNLAVAALGASVRTIGAILMIASAPGVIDGVLHPPGSSNDPDAFRRGRAEGKRLCDWGLKVSPVLVARCPTTAATPRARICSAEEVASGYGNAAAAANANSGKRYDCFPCTMAWLKRQPYTPPADGGKPWPLADAVAYLKDAFGALVPKGPALPCWRQAAQTKGIPGSMTPGAIEAEMARAGDGAEGVVFMLDPLSGEVGHIIGTRTTGSGRNAQVEFRDEQQNMDGRLWFTSSSWQGKWIAFYRTR